MTGLAAGYAIGIVGDAVSSHSVSPSAGLPFLLQQVGGACLLAAVELITVRPGISLRIKSIRSHGPYSHFRVSPVSHSRPGSVSSWASCALVLVSAVRFIKLKSRNEADLTEKSS